MTTHAHVTHTINEDAAKAFGLVTLEHRLYATGWGKPWLEHGVRAAIGASVLRRMRQLDEEQWGEPELTWDTHTHDEER